MTENVIVQQVKPVIFGASGFIGKHLINEIGFARCIPVSRQKNENWVCGDLQDRSSIETVLKHSRTVINLAFSSDASHSDNISMANHLIQACLQSNVTHLIHCSTAIVVGNNPVNPVSDDTECLPETAYEKTKYEIENLFLQAASDKLTVHILRPTGVIGVGGKNLKKMLAEIRYGNPIMNFIRSSINGTRPLNLVSVNDVVNALLHLMKYPDLSSGVYICAADADADNQFHAVEDIMRRILMNPARVKPLRLPNFLLQSLLQIKRSGSGRYPHRHYTSAKLMASGFKYNTPISKTVVDFVLSELQS
jgi:nucleoside-diphosphate-sugar epimerase